MISLAIKLLDDSFRVNVNVAVSPIFREVLFEVKLIVGGSVSIFNVRRFEARLLFPVESEKALANTWMVAGEVLLVGGVKVAV